ncbi:hypothetical protein H2201_003621 [Coniosporium apollinis]|uniref:Protein kinase domain-containing protein n=1 Tax=Coniosporium apollinis TaxID=61459 RepID=A0ABQ9P1C2_9PEZI|nr:hypothetical protein H2201_003621 [Coniosporium apollinis]
MVADANLRLRMESISPAPGKLAELFTDTRRSFDVVTGPEEHKDVPELSPLQQRFRVQKDRYLAWAQEWKDQIAIAQGSIDAPEISKSVSDTLSNIRNILDEAEKTKLMSPTAGLPQAGRNWRKSSLWTGVQGKTRAINYSEYRALERQLTSSVDDLYRILYSQKGGHAGVDLQSQRPRTSQPSHGPASQKAIFSTGDYSASDLTLVNPPTIRSVRSMSIATLPPKIDLDCLDLPEEQPPPYESIERTPCSRPVGRLRDSKGPAQPWSRTTPVLIEYAPFDPAYRTTGVSPPMDRLESLVALLDRAWSDLKPPLSATLKCLGYFEDPNQPRFGVVFELPISGRSGVTDEWKDLEELRPGTLLSVLQSSSKLVTPTAAAPVPAVPALEDRFRLALSLVSTFSKFHHEGFLHKDVNSSNILLFRGRAWTPYPYNKMPDWNIRSPFLVSWDLFSEFNIEASSVPSKTNIYRHPADPRATGDTQSKYAFQFDLYSLGLILVEIGLWVPLADIFKPKYTLEDWKIRIEDIWVKRLAAKCGSAYMRVVRDCLSAADQILMATNVGTEHFSPAEVYPRILRRLETCCLLDEVDFVNVNDDSSLSVNHLGLPSPSVEPMRRTARSSFSSVADMGKKRRSSEKDNSIAEKRRFDLLSSLRSGRPSISKPRSPTISQLVRPLIPPIGSEDMDWQGSQLQEQTSLQHWPVLYKSKSNDDAVDTASLYRERVAAATSTIQRAWRARSEALAFREKKRKVTLIQRQWRKKLQARSTAETRSVCQSQTWYPTPEPEPEEHVVPTEPNPSSSLQEKKEKPKLKVHPKVHFAAEVTDEWHQCLGPRVARIVERTLKDEKESCSISLLAVGETEATTRPTIVVTCTSTKKVKAALTRKLAYDANVFDLKVLRGKIRRSKANRSSKKRPAPHRSMENDRWSANDAEPVNRFHQRRPLCGASIGAYRNGEHLPPVSYGGVILVDDSPFGMSVHHLLDAPSDDEDSEHEDEPSDRQDVTVPELDEEAVRSSAHPSTHPWLAGMGSQPSLDCPEALYPFEISDDEDGEEYDIEETSEHEDPTYDSMDDEPDDALSTASTASSFGDIDGVDPEGFEEIIITQPAIDDVEDDFFPSPEDRDDDHLDSHKLGYVHASSGIRRWTRNGVKHEIDWALFKLDDERLQPYNLVQGGKRYCPNGGPKLCPKLEKPICRGVAYSPDEDEYPIQLAKAEQLGGLKVHCLGRTSGLQEGVVSPTMSWVRFYGRRSFSWSWHVVGRFGVGGDSGAWVIDNEHGRVCGHVLAWCNKNAVAYICPMEVLMEDIKRTLEAQKVSLPGADEEEAVPLRSPLEEMQLNALQQLRISDPKEDRPARLSMAASSPARLPVLGSRALV